MSSIPGSERSPRGGQGSPLQHTCLENPHGQGSLADYSPWDCKESDMTEVTELAPQASAFFKWQMIKMKLV